MPLLASVMSMCPLQQQEDDVLKQEKESFTTRCVGAKSAETICQGAERLRGFASLTTAQQCDTMILHETSVLSFEFQFNRGMLPPKFVVLFHSQAIL